MDETFWNSVKSNQLLDIEGKVNFRAEYTLIWPATFEERPKLQSDREGFILH